jgi:hypothetical protein
MTSREDCSGGLSTWEVDALDDDEVVDVILCRLAELQRVGCESPDCVVIAARVDVGLEPALDLVSRGCPARLVLPILL